MKLVVAIREKQSKIVKIVEFGTINDLIAARDVIRQLRKIIVGRVIWYRLERW